MTISIEYSLESLAKLLNVEFTGDPKVIVTGLATLAGAKTGQLSFYHNPRFLSDLENTRASVVIHHPQYSEQCPCNSLLSDNPYASYARVSRLFEQALSEESGVHESANVHDSVAMGTNIRIGPNSVLEAGVVLGDNVHIQANCFIGKGSQIGAGSVIYANVTIYHGVMIGQRAIIHASTVIGSDGFGYAPDNGTYLKIAQLGGVTIGSDVDIGACSSIDRGALDDTVIEDGVKIDNQVQIAHNVRIGAHTVICGCSAIAGSSSIGKNCTIAGGVGIINHITIVDDVTVTAMSLVNQDIRQKGIYSSGTGLAETSGWKKNIVRFKELDKMSKRLSVLEKNKD